MRSSLRKFMLTAHVTFSVGWFGSVATFLALAIWGLTSGSPQIVRGAYLSMDPIAWYVIFPASLAALLTGLVQSLGTQWGLLRHYWVVVKLVLTVGMVVLLLLHMQVIDKMSAAAAGGALIGNDLRPVQTQLVVDASLAVLVLLVTTVLSIYKPWGRTGFGREKSAVTSAAAADSSLAFRGEATPIPKSVYVLGALIVLFVVITILHLTGNSPMHH